MKLSQEALDLRDFVIRSLPNMVHSYSGKGEFLFPEFNLNPFDYLDFAAKELDTNKSASNKINCVSNLKRAVDCELDTFLHVLNLRKKTMSFPQKIKLINDIGVVNSRSLENLNRIRNKMEHEYQVPDINDLEIYFELANAFVHAMEGFILLYYINGNMIWRANTPDEFNRKLETRYDTENATITFTLTETGLTKESVFKLNGSLDYDDFVFALRIFFLLCRAALLLPVDRVVSMIENIPLDIQNVPAH